MSLRTYCKTKTSKNFANFIKKISGFLKFSQIEFCYRQIFENSDPETFPGVTRGPTKNLGPIGSAVLTFIG